MPHSQVLPATPIELLAPAGDRDALVAAVRNGADAVYVGLETFNARQGADNFDIEGLREACSFAHLRGARVYLTANVLALPEELQEVLGLVDQGWAAGVDAVIVQDLGLLRVLRSELPDVRIHASTQIGAHNTDTVAVLEDLGCARVTLARELSIPEIASIAGARPVETETFVHGALCVCYSGQCLLGSMVGGRSANRGRCAQPCRMPYTLYAPGGDRIDAEGDYLLSPKDLAGISRLPELLSSGVRALKIEGRMKSPEYVALVTGVYRRALDRAIESPEDFDVSSGEWAVLEEAFSRGFTDAYLDGRSGATIMGPKRPNDRGVPLGRVVSAARGEAVVKLEKSLDAADTIEFWTNKGRFSQEAGRLDHQGKSSVTAPAGERVGIRTEQPVGTGDRVFRVENAALMTAARRTFTGSDEPRGILADFTVRVHVGRPLVIEVEAGGTKARAEGPAVEAARTKDITAEEIIEHVGRLGGTAYTASDWDIQLDAGAGMSYGVLHAVRRDALERLDEARIGRYEERAPRTPRLPSVPMTREADLPVLVAVVADSSVAAVCHEAGADKVLVADAFAGSPDRLEAAEPLLARVARGGEVDRMLDTATTWGRATAGNLGVLSRVADEGLPVGAYWPLNATNVHAVAALAGLRADTVWLSPELTMEQIRQVAPLSPVPVGVGVLGPQELMVTEHCVLQSAGECDQRCAGCDRRNEWWQLEDRQGYRFPVRTDAAGRSHLFNAVPMDVTHAFGELMAAGVSAFRLDLELLSAHETTRLVAAAKARLRAAIAGDAPPRDRLLDPSTTGHFFRGIT